MIGNTQMPRKFLLGRMRKNAERNRQKAHHAQGTNKIGRMVGELNDYSTINMALYVLIYR